MSIWTAPSEGTWHFLSAPGASPHRFEDCDEVQCHGVLRRGWLGWVAKGATVDLDDDSTGEAPGGNPLPSWQQ